MRKQAQKKRAISSLYPPLQCLPLTSRRPVVIIGNGESSGFSRKFVKIVGKLKIAVKAAKPACKRKIAGLVLTNPAIFMCNR
jgi:hypothetical protein